MCKRFIYTLYHAWQHRQSLRALVQDANQHIQCVTELTFKNLQALNVKGLVLDFDGVLAAHGENEVTDAVYTWLKQLQQQPIKLFILTNKPNSTRQRYFEEYFKKIIFIKAPKKPYPQGLLSVIQQLNCSASEVLLVDDRLLTGGLATILAGCQIKWVRKPFVNYKKRPIIERFFMGLRKLEAYIFG